MDRGEGRWEREVALSEGGHPGISSCHSVASMCVATPYRATRNFRNGNWYCENRADRRQRCRGCACGKRMRLWSGIGRLFAVTGSGEVSGIR